MQLPLEEFDKHRMEHKFYISLSEAASLRARLSQVMQKDPHSDPCGRYLITSIYFDTPDGHSLLGSQAGLEKRKKIRIRAYNHSTSYIKIEYKEKNGKLSRKRGMRITLEECNRILGGDPSPLLSHVTEGDTAPSGKSALALQLYHDLSVNGYRPSTVVEYTREIFIHPISRVRITLDTHICGYHATEELFTHHALLSTMAEDLVLLEVKYSHFLPAFIAALLPRNCMTSIANSKFLRARTQE